LFSTPDGRQGKPAKELATRAGDLGCDQPAAGKRSLLVRGQGRVNHPTRFRPLAALRSNMATVRITVTGSF
jgi:hypothetical protein